MLYLELAIVTILIVVNGLLSMSELAIVSSRPARLAGLVEKGVSGARPALALAADYPGKFLFHGADRHHSDSECCRAPSPAPRLDSA